MEIIDKIKTNKSDDNLTEIQKICLHKLQSSPLPILKVNYGDFQINQIVKLFRLLN